MIAIYIFALVLANLLVWWIGPWWSPFNSLLLIGLDLTLRDKLHERIGVWRSAGLVGVAGAISYLANPAAGMIAVASVVAFVAAGLADTAIYQALLRKKPLIKINGSNIAGAAVDSFLFPTIAFGAVMPHIVALQFIAKVAGGAAYAWIIERKNR